MSSVHCDIMIVFVVCSNAMDAACSLEGVTGLNKVIEMLSNAEQDLCSSMNYGDITPEKTRELVPNAEKLLLNATTLSSPSAHRDLNSNSQKRAKTKGTLRQQLHMKRQQLVSGSVAVSSGETATGGSDKKKSPSSNRAASQVNCPVGLHIFTVKHYFFATC